MECLSQSNIVYLETNYNNKMQGPDVPMKSSAPQGHMILGPYDTRGTASRSLQSKTPEGTQD